PETQSCETGGDQAGGVTGLNCAGFGSAMVVTASFGLVAAAHVLCKLAQAGAKDTARSATEPALEQV
ncbi:MAG: tRNA cyclic N6-threonylcarbamoyladenosine(37) synthase TcdA, partial [Bacillota bacterium]